MNRLASVVLAFVAACGVAQAQAEKEPLRLDQGSRVGILYLLEKDLTHYHIGFTMLGNQYKTYPVGWPIAARFEKPLLEAIAERGYAGVSVTPPEVTNTDRIKIYGRAGTFTRSGLSREAITEYRRVADAEQLAALIIVAPHAHDVVRTAGSFMTRKSWTFPDLAADWGLGTRGKHGKSAPVIFNLSNLMLFDMRGAEPVLVGQVLGADDSKEWGNKNWPEDMKDVAPESFEGARPILEGMIDRQVSAFLLHLAPATRS